MGYLEYVYLSCFLLGGTVMLLQFVLGLLGLGGDHDSADGHDFHDVGHDAHGHAGHDAHDTAHDHYMAWFMGVLTLRSIVAALTFFGLGGLAAMQAQFDPPFTVAIAVAAGAGAMFLVAAIMRGLTKLKADGTVRIERSVGKTGTVYLKVPGQKSGSGKVHLNLQNRTVEYQAITSSEELPTGAKILVVSVISSDTVEVVPATEAGSTTHA
jgi:hypothetical protein